MRPIFATGAAFALVGLIAGPAFADCAMEIVKTKEMADNASSPSKREMALEHLTMAQEKIVHVSSMQGDHMKMKENGSMAMEGGQMKEGQATESGQMSKGEHMAMGGKMEGQQMAMGQDACMAEVMKAKQALK